MPVRSKPQEFARSDSSQHGRMAVISILTERKDQVAFLGRTVVPDIDSLVVRDSTPGICGTFQEAGHGVAEILGLSLASFRRGSWSRGIASFIRGSQARKRDEIEFCVRSKQRLFTRDDRLVERRKCRRKSALTFEHRCSLSAVPFGGLAGRCLAPEPFWLAKCHAGIRG